MGIKINIVIIQSSVAVPQKPEIELSLLYQSDYCVYYQKN